MGPSIQKQFSQADVELLSEKTCYSGFFKLKQLKVRCRLFEGGWSQIFARELILRHPAVGILIYDPAQDKVLMIEQFRIACMNDDKNGPWSIELVAGLIDKGEGSAEKAEEVAKREAEEEAGIKLDQLISVCDYYNSPGGSTEKVSLFCALVDLSRVKEGVFGLESENENIRSLIIDRAVAEKAVQEGRINNAMSIIAIQWLSLNVEKLKL